MMNQVVQQGLIELEVVSRKVVRGCRNIIKNTIHQKVVKIVCCILPIRTMARLT